MTRLVAAVVLALFAALMGCGADAEKKAATTTPDDSVVLGTDPIPTQPARRKPRPRPKKAARPEPARNESVPERPSRGQSSKQLTMVGDSLAVGTEALLPGALPGWTVRTDASKGRPLNEGMQVLSSLNIPTGSVLAFSLFTNDPPGATSALQAALSTAGAKAGAGGCQVWATIARPGRGEPANDTLRRLDGSQVGGATVIVADWAELVQRRPSLLAPDGIHGTPEGYRARAQLYADAVNRC